MTKSGELISQLLRYYLWEDSPAPDRDIFNKLSTQEWSELHSLSLREGVSAMILDAMISAEIDIPRQVKMKFILSTSKIENKYAEKVKTISWLENIYSENGIDMMILKGVGLAALYPVPNHRPCSDVDIWLFGKQVEADQILRQKYGIPINEGQHHHTVFHINGVMVENHYDFIEQHSRSSRRKMEEHLKRFSECESPIKTEIAGTSVYTPAPNLNALFLIIHAGSHFAAENISIRHLTDWAVFLKHYKERVDWEQLHQIGEQFGFKHFLECLNAMCIDFLGMPEKLASCRSLERNLIDRALDDVLEYKQKNIPKNFIKGWIFRINRRISNLWKQKIVYNDSHIGAFFLSFLAHIIHPKQWKKRK